MLNYILKGAQQHFLRKGALYEDNLNLYCNFAKGTTAKAQGTAAIAVGALGYLEACTTVFTHSQVCVKHCIKLCML